MPRRIAKKSHDNNKYGDIIKSAKSITSQQFAQSKIENLQKLVKNFDDIIKSGKNKEEILSLVEEKIDIILNYDHFKRNESNYNSLIEDFVRILIKNNPKKAIDFIEEKSLKFANFNHNKLFLAAVLSYFELNKENQEFSALESLNKILPYLVKNNAILSGGDVENFYKKESKIDYILNCDFDVNAIEFLFYFIDIRINENDDVKEFADKLFFELSKSFFDFNNVDNKSIVLKIIFNYPQTLLPHVIKSGINFGEFLEAGLIHHILRMKDNKLLGEVLKTIDYRQFTDDDQKRSFLNEFLYNYSDYAQGTDTENLGDDALKTVSENFGQVLNYIFEKDPSVIDFVTSKNGFARNFLALISEPNCIDAALYLSKSNSIHIDKNAYNKEFFSGILEQTGELNKEQKNIYILDLIGKYLSSAPYNYTELETLIKNDSLVKNLYDTFNPDILKNHPSSQENGAVYNDNIVTFLLQSFKKKKVFEYYDDIVPIEYFFLPCDFDENIDEPLNFALKNNNEEFLNFAQRTFESKFETIKDDKLKAKVEEALEVIKTRKAEKENWSELDLHQNEIESFEDDNLLEEIDLDDIGVDLNINRANFEDKVNGVLNTDFSKTYKLNYILNCATSYVYYAESKEDIFSFLKFVDEQIKKYIDNYKKLDAKELENFYTRFFKACLVKDVNYYDFQEEYDCELLRKTVEYCAIPKELSLIDLNDFRTAEYSTSPKEFLNAISYSRSKLSEKIYNDIKNKGNENEESLEKINEDAVRFSKISYCEDVFLKHSKELVSGVFSCYDEKSMAHYLNSIFYSVHSFDAKTLKQLFDILDKDIIIKLNKDLTDIYQNIHAGETLSRAIIKAANFEPKILDYFLEHLAPVFEHVNSLKEDCKEQKFLLNLFQEAFICATSERQKRLVARKFGERLGLKNTNQGEIIDIIFNASKIGDNSLKDEFFAGQKKLNLKIELELEKLEEVHLQEISNFNHKQQDFKTRDFEEIENFAKELVEKVLKRALEDEEALNNAQEEVFEDLIKDAIESFVKIEDKKQQDEEIENFAKELVEKVLKRALEDEEALNNAQEEVFEDLIKDAIESFVKDLDKERKAEIKLLIEENLKQKLAHANSVLNAKDIYGQSQLDYYQNLSGIEGKLKEKNALELKSLTKENDDLKAEIERLKKENGALKDKHESASKNNNKKNQALQNEQEKLQEELLQTKLKLENLMKHLNKAKQDKYEHIIKNNLLENELNEKNTENDSLRAEINRQNKSLEDLGKRMQQSKWQQSENLKNAKKKLTQAQLELQQTKENAQEELDKLRSEIKKKKANQVEKAEKSTNTEPDNDDLQRNNRVPEELEEVDSGAINSASGEENSKSDDEEQEFRPPFDYSIPPLYIQRMILPENDALRQEIKELTAKYLELQQQFMNAQYAWSGQHEVYYPQQWRPNVNADVFVPSSNPISGHGGRLGNENNGQHY